MAFYLSPRRFGVARAVEYFLCRPLPPDADDIVLDSIAVSHIEQADDVALFSTTPEGVNRLEPVSKTPM
ncbi:hypothetical protein B0H19DRAFT_1174650 [Mycena capillaripes]|nr:hypothetical protein B0H19DRAFT_1174650 [Mycena capillaripes]